MENAILAFALDAAVERCVPYGEGHVNHTWLVHTGGKRCILQRLSQTAFLDIPGLMENVAAVTDFLSRRITDPRGCLRLIPTRDGETFCRDDAGEYWRMYDFIENSLCLQAPESPEDFYQSAVAFGTFQRLLRDFPADTLHETIPNFHNTPNRYRNFHAALQADPLGRAKQTAREIDFLLEHEGEAGILQAARESGALPLRVTHNDTKLNNVLLDSQTRKALCVIDLDTVMPGLAAYDFGDAIRFGASTGPEDARNPETIQLDLALYRRFAEGFLASCGILTAEERDSLPLGAKLMTLENGLRFLTDYLEGDHYFAISRPEQNLDRARTQIHLFADIEDKWDAVRRITKHCG